MKDYVKQNMVAIYSGGMDSFTLVNEAHSQGRLHSCLSFDYGQRHSKELAFAEGVCLDLGVTRHVISLASLKPHLLGSALTDAVEMPQGHYAEGNMKLTVVPNRNMVMLSIAIAYAVSHNLDEVWFGAHSGDHDIYPDCREEFVAAMSHAAQISNWHPVSVYAPYQNLDKQSILDIGARLGLDYARSWTCYVGGEKACGRCGSCQERLTAFAARGETDPLDYETRVLLPKEAA
jgi:7-cyano-7-deazaguanine synthase